MRGQERRYLIMKTRSKSIRIVPIAAVLGASSLLLAQDNSNAAGGKGAQVTALYRLQASFHRASTVRDPVSGEVNLQDRSGHSHE
jgi:hypothetical protein